MKNEDKCIYCSDSPFISVVDRVTWLRHWCPVKEDDTTHPKPVEVWWPPRVKQN